jgi:hypothetical protein
LHESKLFQEARETSVQPEEMNEEEVMAEHKVRKRQMQKLEKAEESTERLARLHHRDAELQSSARMEMLKKIAADSVLYFDGVSRAVKGYRNTVHTEMKTDDPLTTYVRGMLTYAETGKRSRNALPARYRREADGLRLLNVNHFIQEVVQALRRIVKKRVKLQAVLADRDMRIMADWEKMSQVFVSIVAYGSEIIRKGGTITILAKVLPIENDLLEKGGGRCALLSVSSTDVAVNRSESGHKDRAGKSVRRAFSAIRSVIGGHNGSVRVLKQQGRAQFNIYLPVVHGT